MVAATFLVLFSSTYWNGFHSCNSRSLLDCWNGCSRPPLCLYEWTPLVTARGWNIHNDFCLWHDVSCWNGIPFWFTFPTILSLCRFPLLLEIWRVVLVICSNVACSISCPLEISSHSVRAPWKQTLGVIPASFALFSLRVASFIFSVRVVSFTFSHDKHLVELSSRWES